MHQNPAIATVAGANAQDADNASVVFGVKYPLSNIGDWNTTSIQSRTNSA